MELLFVIQRFYPYDDATSNCIKSIIPKLIAQGCNIHVLCTKADEKISDNEEYMGAKIHRVFDATCYSHYQLLDTFKENKLLALKLFVLKIINAIIFFTSKTGSNFLVVKKFEKAIKKLNNEYKFDSICSVVADINTAIAVKNIKTKRQDDFTFCLYQVDPYSTNITHGVKNKNVKSKLEKEIYEELSAIITTPIIKNEAMKTYSHNITDKMVSSQFPNLKYTPIVKTADDIILDKNYINIVFTGLLYSDIRSPEYTLNFLSKVKNDKIRVYLIGGGCPVITEKYKNIMGESLVISSGKSMQACFNVMKNADVLLNIGNTALNQVPSKIFDYFSTGSPILNICKSRNCPTLPYMEQYPLALNIFEEDDILNEQIVDFETFLNEKLDKKLDFEEVKEIFKESTPEYVAQQFLSALS